MLAVELALVDEKDFPCRAEGSFVDAQVSPQTGTIRVRAKCPKPDGLISPGCPSASA
jgi:multidrug efflux pump subunit AcrA (membrane-fusion protein)